MEKTFSSLVHPLPPPSFHPLAPLPPPPSPPHPPARTPDREPQSPASVAHCAEPVAPSPQWSRLQV